MSAPAFILTARLVLRRDWREADRASLARMCADPHVMRYFERLWDRAQTDAAVDRWQAHFSSHGYFIWAVEERETGTFVGMVGVIDTRPDKPFPRSQTELAWRVDRSFWGRGYAGEAAIAAGNDALARSEIPELMAYTTASNAPSRRVMEKLGLTRRADENFDHPNIATGDPLRPQVVYRIGAQDWRARHGPPGAPLTLKVAIYATWRGRLLVFRQPDFPAAGIQVPGGTVDAGETLEAAARREFFEETGIALAGPIEALGRSEDHVTSVERHFFRAELEGSFPERWTNMEKSPSIGGPPILFELFWVDLEALPELSGDLGALIEATAIR